MNIRRPFQFRITSGVQPTQLHRTAAGVRRSSARRLASVFALFAFVSFGAPACGGDATYAEQHIDSIERDCQSTATCDPVFSIRADAIEECVRDTSAKLNIASAAFRAGYEQRTARCAQFTGCQYFDCAGDTMLFSATHEAQLRYECQQNTLCKIQSGLPTMPNDNDTCFGELANKLDFAAIADRAGWEQRFARCSTQQACAYMTCP